MDTTFFKRQLDAEACHDSKPRVCHWTNIDPVWLVWKGGCGVQWYFDQGDPEDNGMNYCPQCGGVVKLETFESQQNGETPNE